MGNVKTIVTCAPCDEGRITFEEEEKFSNYSYFVDIILDNRSATQRNFVHAIRLRKQDENSKEIANKIFDFAKDDKGNFLKIIFLLASKTKYDEACRLNNEEIGIFFRRELFNLWEKNRWPNRSIYKDLYRLGTEFGVGKGAYYNLLTPFISSASELYYLVCFIGRTYEKSERIWALNVKPKDIILKMKDGHVLRKAEIGEIFSKYFEGILLLQKDKVATVEDLNKERLPDFTEIPIKQKRALILSLDKPKATQTTIKKIKQISFQEKYSTYLQALSEKFETEFPTPTSVLTSDYVELEALPLTAKSIQERQTKPLEPSKDIIEVMKNNKTLAIVGDAGSGKSFTLHKIVMDCAKNRLPWIPIYVKLLDVPPSKALENWIDLHFFEKFDSNLTIDGLKSEDNKESFFFLFDGLDEVGSEDNRRNMESAISNLMKNFKQSRYAITTRPVGYEKELSNFTNVQIEPLDKQIPEVVSIFFKKDRKKRDKVLDHLDKDKAFKELASNPYQLFLICNTVKNDGELPHNKGHVFKNFIESIKTWRERPKRERGIHKYFDFLQEIFRQAAFQILDEDLRYINEENLCDIVEKIRGKTKKAYPNFHPIDIINEYAMKSGFLQRIYDNNKVGYNFIHLAWRDYFAACCLQVMEQEKLVPKLRDELLEHMKWDDTISLLVGMVDQNTSDKILNLLTGLDPFFSAKCLSMTRNVTSCTEDRLIMALSNKLKVKAPRALNEKVINSLGITKSRKVMEPLIEFAEKTKDIGYILRISHALVGIEQAKAIELLIKLVEGDDDIELVYSVADILAEIVTKQGAVPLIELLEQEAPPYFLEGVAVALGRIKSAKAIKSLVRLSKRSKNLYLRSTIASVLGDIEPQEGIYIFDELSNETNDTDTLERIALSLADFRSEKTKELLINLLERINDTSVTQKVAFELGDMEIEDRSGIDKLVVDRTGHRNIPIEVPQRLLDRKPRDVIGSILEPSNKSEPIDIFISWKMGKINTQETIQILVQLLEKSEDIEHVSNIADIFKQVGPEEAVDAVAKRLEKSKNTRLLKNVAWVLAEIRSENAEEALRKLSKESKDAFLLQRTTRDFEKTRKEKTIELLEQLSHKRIRDEILEIQIGLPIIPEKKERVIDCLFELLEKSKDFGLLDNIMHALQNVASKNSVELLINVLEKTDNSEVIQKMASAFEDVMSKRDKKLMTKLLGKTKNTAILMPEGQTDRKPRDVIGSILEPSHESEPRDILTSYRIKRINARRAVDILREIIEKNGNTLGIMQIVDVIGEIGTDEATKLLSELAEKRQYDVAFKHIVYALGHIGTDKAIEVLSKLSKLPERTKHADDLEAIVSALGWTGSEKAIALIIKLSQKSEICRISTIVGALGKIESPKSLEPIIQMARKSKDIGDSWTIAYALESLRHAYSQTETLMGILVKVYETCHNRKIMRETFYMAIEGIKRMTGRRFLKELESFYD